MLIQLFLLLVASAPVYLPEGIAGVYCYYVAGVPAANSPGEGAAWLFNSEDLPLVHADVEPLYKQELGK